MQGVTFIDCRKNIFLNHAWMETSLPPDHVIQEMGTKRRNNRGSFLDFMMGLEGFCMREGKKEKKAATLLYLFHCALCLIPYEFVVFSLSPSLPPAPPLPAFWKVTRTIVRSSADVCLFLLACVPHWLNFSRCFFLSCINQLHWLQWSYSNLHEMRIWPIVPTLVWKQKLLSLMLICSYQINVCLLALMWTTVREMSVY